MTRLTPLLERNEEFARGYTPAPLGPPAQQVLIVTCLDHRVDPAAILGVRLGDAPVIRNAGGRVTQAVIDDVSYLAFLAGQLFADEVAAGSSRSRSSSTPSAGPRSSPIRTSAARPPRRRAWPRDRWRPPPSPIRTSP